MQFSPGTMALYAGLALGFAADSASRPKGSDAQASDSAYYHYYNDSIPLTIAEEVVSGTLTSAQDTSWLRTASSALEVRRLALRASRPGFFVLYFGPSVSPQSARDFREELKRSDRASMVLPGYRTSDGTRLVLNGNVVLRFLADTRPDQIDSLTTTLGLQLVRSTDRPGFRRYVFKSAARNGNPLAVANALQKSGLVEYATPDFAAGRPQTIPSDSFFVQQYHLNNSIAKNGIPVDIRAVGAWDWSLGTNIKIAVLDSGVDCDHPEFAGRVLTGRDALGLGDECDPEGLGFGDAHGTNAAGIALASHGSGKIAGVAPGGKLIPIRLWRWVNSEETDFADASDIADAIRWAWDTAGADVMSNSWSGPYNSDIAGAITDAAVYGRGGLGTPMIFAAGNEVLPIGFPATANGSYAVSGINRRGNDSRYRRGARVVAPTDSNAQAGSGSDSGLPTADIRGNVGRNSGCSACSNDYGDTAYTKYWGGTSAATPQVAGLAALILQLRPQWTASMVTDLINSTADDWHTAGWDSITGYGKINAYRAVRIAGPTLDVTVWGSPGTYITTKGKVWVLDSTIYWWNGSQHSHSWKKDGSPYSSHGSNTPRDTTSFMVYLNECYETTFRVDVTENWKTGFATRLFSVNTQGAGCEIEPPVIAGNLESVNHLHQGQRSRGPLYGAGPAVFADRERGGAFYISGVGAVGTAHGRFSPAVAHALNHRTPTTFRLGGDTLTLEPVPGGDGTVSVHRFALTGTWGRSARTLAFTFDPDIGNAANDVLTWHPEGGIAIAGDSVDGFWGVRLFERSLQNRRVFQTSRGQLTDPRTVEELGRLIESRNSVIAEGPRDVRFTMAGDMTPPLTGKVTGIVAWATNRDAREVLVSLQALDPEGLLAEADRAQPTTSMPRTFSLGQVLADYAGPLARIDESGLSALSSTTNALERVKTGGITTLRLDVPASSGSTTVTVIVFSVDGKQVRVLVREALEPGRYVLGWDGKDDRGRRVQPGVYVAVMTAGSFRGQRRLVVR